MLQQNSMQAGLAETSPFDVMGISVTTCNKDGQAAEDINNLWKRFFEDGVAHKIENRMDDVIYAVYSGYEGDHNDPYMLTIGYRITSTSKIPDNMDIVRIPAAQYAVIAAQGPQPETLIKTWESIWSSDIKRAFTVDFEVYGPRFFQEGVHEVLINIAIQEGIA